MTDKHTDIAIGCIVKSLTGRDAGGYFVIVSPPDDSGYVLMCDGKVRKLAKPKRKKLKHIKAMGIVLEDLQIRLKSNPPTDRQLYRMINSAVQKAEQV